LYDMAIGTLSVGSLVHWPLMSELLHLVANGQTDRQTDGRYARAV